MSLNRNLNQFDSAPRFPNWLIFVFGISLSTDVIYPFKIGNTVVYIGYAFALILAIAVFVMQPPDAVPKSKAVDKSVLLFCGVTFCSFIVSFILSLLGFVPVETPMVSLRGLAVLLCGLAVYFVVASLGGRIKPFLAGIGAGIVTNGVFSICAQRAFNSGSFFTLYNLFPQDAFSISARWEIWAQLPLGAGLLPYYRPQGLFLETSHLMVFLVCFAPLAFIASNNRVLRVLMLLASGYCAVTSLSPNSVFLILETAFLWMFSLKGEKHGSLAANIHLTHSGIFITLVIIFAAILVFLFNFKSVSNAFALLFSGISDLNVAGTSDTGTLERLNSMVKAAAVAFNYPLGSGWNTESQILQFWYGSSDVASHSYVIRLLIETGLPGLVAYLYLIARHAFPLLKKRKSVFRLALGLAVLFLVICQATNGTPLLPWVWALLGLAKTSINHPRVEEEYAL